VPRIYAQDEPQGNDWRDAAAPRANLKGSMMDGVLQGAGPVRTVIVAIRGLYDYQEFHFVGPYGENGWMEDYTAGVRGQPIKNVTLPSASTSLPVKAWSAHGARCRALRCRGPARCHAAGRTR
jgi:hypothetical protein